jgi:transposase
MVTCATGITDREAAARLGVSEATVGKWRRRFVAKGVDGLLDEDRPGHPAASPTTRSKRVIVKTLEDKPAGATHWSTRSRAQATGMSQTSIGLIWPGPTESATP